MAEVKVVDKNLMVESTVDKSGLKMYDVREKPFKIYGVMLPDEAEDKFKRLPLKLAENINSGVVFHHANTSGGRIRFKTNSKTVAIRAEMPFVERFPHIALTGSAGFDIYSDGEYFRTFVPPYDMVCGYEAEHKTDGKMHEYTINMPTYSDVSRIYIMLDEDADLKESEPYRFELPVVYYGSSITQGGCVSRPGNTYQAIISRRLNIDYVNLGFSGSARGEDTIAEHIAGLKMQAFVYDYDHNAPSPEHLKNTHSRMLGIIREKHPNIPIICVTRPGFKDETAAERKAIILDTVLTAKKSGDENIYFIDGKSFSEQFSVPGDITVDNTHPTDLGFAAMAKVIGDLLEKILKIL